MEIESRSDHRQAFLNIVVLIILFSTITSLISPASILASDASVDNIGFRTETPGPFLRWPLKPVNTSAITRLPDSPWTHQFLGITDCPPYPALIDAGYWPFAYAGNYQGNRSLIKAGTPDDQVKWQNRTAKNEFANAIACYGARQDGSLPTHAGTDISEWNGADVLAAADSNQVQVVYNAGEYRVRLRHRDVNGSGQTWYSYYVHLSSAVWNAGTYNVTVVAGQKVGSVGKYHLHFETSVGPNYSPSEARNPWGRDQSPWDGCLWLDQTLCPIAATPTVENTSLSEPSGGHFPDVPISSFWYPYIEALYRVGAVRGTSNGRFEPTQLAERDQAAKMIDLGLGRNPNYRDGEPAFTDVTTNHPFYQYIRDLKEMGIVRGYQNGLYFNDPTKPDPDNKRVTRCQVATLIVRSRGDNPNYTDNRQAYTDVPPSHACYQYIQHLYEIGASPYGGSQFYPDAYIERQRIAYAIVRGLPRLLDQIVTFVDVNYDHPFYSHIEAIYQRGITNGCDSALSPPYLKYCPDESLKRGQAAAFVSRALGFQALYTDGRRSFPNDVPTTHPFYHYIEHLYELGVVQGYSDGTFRPDDPVSRRQFAQMIVRGLGVLNIPCPTDHTAAFPDVLPGSNGYAEIQCLKDLGISSGFSNGNYEPDRVITRAAAAKLMDLAFLRKIADIPQEPDEVINDNVATAPLYETLPAQTSLMTDTVGSLVGYELNLPNYAGNQDVDHAQFVLEAGKEYVLSVPAIGENTEVDLTISNVSGQNRDGISDLVVDLSFSPSLTTGDRAIFTANSTGRYIFSFRNKTPFAKEGVNLRFAVREVSQPASVTLVGSVSPQAKDVALNWQNPVSVTLTPATGGNSVINTVVTPDRSGVFTVSVATAGEYVGKVKAVNSLRNSRTVQLVSGVNRFDFGELRTGDANDDNQVKIQDFSLLAHSFNKCTGGNGFNPRTDFDSNGCAKIRDFSLMATNFNRTGDITVTSEPREDATTDTPAATLSLASADMQVTVGQVFEVVVVGEMAVQGVDAVAFDLAFDPALFDVISIAPTALLPMVLAAEIDDATGRVAFAAGTFEPLAAGRHLLAALQVRALQPGLGTVSFVNNPGDAPELYGAGNAVITTVANLSVMVAGELPAPDSNDPRVYLPLVGAQND